MNIYCVSSFYHSILAILDFSYPLVFYDPCIVFIGFGFYLLFFQ